jgi:hypothetical protein
MTQTWKVDGLGFHRVSGSPLFIRDQYKNIIADKIATVETARTMAAAPTMLAALIHLQTWLIAPAFDAETIQEMREVVAEAIKTATPVDCGF